MKDNVSHEGHRQRLKNRFLNDGLSGFEKHNILELLLFYSIPQKDTNDIAHELLDTFGSLKGVFDADFNELIKVKGVKENTATLIKLIPQLSREYMLDEFDEEKVFDKAEKIGKYFIRKYIGEINEVVYMMLLDNGYKLLSVVKLHEGSVNSAKISPRQIMTEIIKHNASMVVLAHNHPNGVAVPSMEDVNTTYSLKSTLSMYDAKLIEHILVAGNEYFPILNETQGINDRDEEHKRIFRKL